jgi:hypothetical protein
MSADQGPPPGAYPGPRKRPCYGSSLAVGAKIAHGMLAICTGSSRSASLRVRSSGISALSSPGVDFVDEVERAVESCDVLIALIGRQWLDVVDGADHRRLDDPSDFVRLAIATALERDDYAGW